MLLVEGGVLIVAGGRGAVGQVATHGRGAPHGARGHGPRWALHDTRRHGPRGALWWVVGGPVGRVLGGHGGHGGLPHQAVVQREGVHLVAGDDRLDRWWLHMECGVAGTDQLVGEPGELRVPPVRGLQLGVDEGAHGRHLAR